MEYEFLFQYHTKSQLSEILKILFYQLKYQHASFLPVQCQNCHQPQQNHQHQHMDVVFHYIATQVLKSPALPIPNQSIINDFDVPMFRSDKINFSNLPWDIAFQHIILYIDGISHVKKIAKEAVMDLDMVKKALSLLVFHGAIIITDIFRFSNIYALNEDLYNGNVSLSSATKASLSADKHNVCHCADRLSLLGDPAILSEMRDFACMGYIAAYSTTNAANLNSVSTPGNPATSSTTKQSMSSGGTYFSESNSYPQQSDIPSFTDIIDFLLQLQPNIPISHVLLSSIPTVEKNGNIPTAGQQKHNRSRANSKTNDGESAVDIGEFDRSEHSVAGGISESINQCFMKRLRNLDIARLLAYAQMKGIIRRVHGFPIYLPIKSPLPPPLESQSPGVQRGLGSSSRNNSNLLLDSPSSGDDQDLSPIEQSTHRGFSKLSRTGTVISNSFIREHTSANTAANSRCKSGHSALPSIPEIIQMLDGSEHLDAICCKYDLNSQEVISHPNIHIIYK
jgi:hypothetical protein